MKRRDFRILTAPVNEPRWIKTYDRTGRELDSRRIEPLVDLYQFLIVEAARWIADGWTIDEEVRRVSCGFFVTRGDARRELRIVPEERSKWTGTYKPYG